MYKLGKSDFPGAKDCTRGHRSNMYPSIKLLLFSFALFSIAYCSDDYSLETCLQKDSISCIQIHVYKKLRALLSKQTIDLLAGFRIVKDKSEKPETSIVEDSANEVDGKIYNALQVSDRQMVLEDFIFSKVLNFFNQRSIHWNMMSAIEQIVPTARKIFSSIPGNVKDKIAHYVAEGRGKKKFMKFFFPVIIAFKMTVFTWVKIIYVGVGLIAKKALIISIIALCVAIFAAVKKHTTKEYRPPHYEIHGEAIHSVPYYPVGWPSGGHSSHDSYDSHGSGSSSTHYLAYAAQKPNY